jgi:hypothetical protein
MSASVSAYSSQKEATDKQIYFCSVEKSWSELG